MLKYRTIMVALSIPSVSLRDAEQQAQDIARARLSCLRADDSLLPIRAELKGSKDDEREDDGASSA